MIAHDSSSGHQLSLWILEVLGTRTGQEINIIEIINMYDPHLRIP